MRRARLRSPQRAVIGTDGSQYVSMDARLQIGIAHCSRSGCFIPSTFRRDTSWVCKGSCLAVHNFAGCRFGIRLGRRIA